MRSWKLRAISQSSKCRFNVALTALSRVHTKYHTALLEKGIATKYSINCGYKPRWSSVFIYRKATVEQGMQLYYMMLRIKNVDSSISIIFYENETSHLAFLNNIK